MVIVDLPASNWGPGAEAEGEIVAEADLRFLRQNGDPIATSGPDAYLMVSKVRPDWLLPESDLGYSLAEFENNVPFPNVGTASDNAHYDPDTYRLEVSGIPAVFTAAELRFRVNLEGAVGPVPILENGHEGEKVLSLATMRWRVRTKGTTRRCAARSDSSDWSRTRAHQTERSRSAEASTTTR